MVAGAYIHTHMPAHTLITTYSGGQAEDNAPATEIKNIVSVVPDYSR